MTIELSVLILVAVSNIATAGALIFFLKRLAPVSKRKLDPAQAESIVADVIREARLAAEQMALLNKRNGHETNGAEKQREAIRHITQRLEPLGLVIDYNTIAMRLEAEVAGANEKK
jgi:hypothetical protein